MASAGSKVRERLVIIIVLLVLLLVLIAVTMIYIDERFSRLETEQHEIWGDGRFKR